MDKLENLLKHTKYDKVKAKFLIQGFRQGFSIGYQGPANRQSRSNNIPFTKGVGDRQEMWQKIMTEVDANRVAGPFAQIPFASYIQSPIGLIPKHGGKTRLIFHLSYNFTQNPNDASLNHFTPKHMCSVHYNDLDYAVCCCLKTEARARSSHTGSGSVYLAKTDLRMAFRMLPVKKEHWRWLVFKAVDPQTGKTMYFVDKCLPFGASISCALFQKFSNALHHILAVITGTKYTITNYLDDFLFTEIMQNRCNKMVSNFSKICEDINLPIVHDKTEYATTRIIFLGILLDGEHLLLAVPIEKKDRALTTINYLLNKRKAMVKQLQQFTGYLNFLCKAIHPGRSFTRRMYSKFSNILDGNTKLKPYHHVKLDNEFKFDCLVWKQFLESELSQVVCRPMLDLSEHVSAVELDFATDASAGETLGWGGVFGEHWIFGIWPPRFIKDKRPSIAYLELFALVASVIAYEEELKNIRINIQCDNQSLVEMVNSTTSKCPNCMFLIRLLVLSGLKFNRRTYVRYIQSKKNCRADALSRLRFQHFFNISSPSVDREPTPIPTDLWPVDKIWQNVSC